MPSTTSRRPRWILPATIAAALALIVAIIIFGFVLLGGIPPTSAAAPSSEPPPSPVATDAPPIEQVAALEEKLASDDPVVLADALALDKEQLTPEMIAGFGSSTLSFNLAEAALLSEDTWEIPVTVTDETGAASPWIVTVVDSSDGLVFADSREAE